MNKYLMIGLWVIAACDANGDRDQNTPAIVDQLIKREIAELDRKSQANAMLAKTFPVINTIVGALSGGYFGKKEADFCELLRYPDGSVRFSGGSRAATIRSSIWAGGRWGLFFGIMGSIMCHSLSVDSHLKARELGKIINQRAE